MNTSNSPAGNQNRSDAQINRRDALKGFALVLGMAGSIGAYANKEKIWELLQGHGHAEAPEVIERLLENKNALEEIRRDGLQAYIERQQLREAVTVPKPKNSKKMLCVDDRCKDEGPTEGRAGVGILLNDDDLKKRAEEEVKEAEDALRAGEERYEITICPHAKCGAAALYRKNKGEADMSPQAVATSALEGGVRMKAAIDKVIVDRGLVGKVTVRDVELLKEEHFVQAHHHPGAIAYDYDDDVEMNSDRKTGAMMYNVKSVEDGILSAKIAFSHHGMHQGHGETKIPEATPFRIAIERADAQKAAERARAYQRELLKPEYNALRGKIIIQVVNRPAAQAQAGHTPRKAA